MTTTLTGNGSVYDNTVAAPADGDVANGTLFQTVAQRLLNNARWLYEKVTTVGVDAVRSVVDTTALKALTGMVTGSVAIVRGQGFYVYVDPSAVAEALPYVVAPTVGTGRWSTAAAPAANRIIAIYNGNGGGAIVGAAATIVNDTAPITVGGLKAGDKLIIQAQFQLDITVSSSETGYLAGLVRVSITSPPSTVSSDFRTFGPGIVTSGQTRRACASVIYSYPIQAAEETAGSVSVVGAGYRTGDITGWSNFLQQLHVMHIRP